jgi:hypothetical protein
MTKPELFTMVPDDGEVFLARPFPHKPLERDLGSVYYVQRRPDKKRATRLTEAAQAHRDNHHWVSLRLTGKKPVGEEWQKRKLADPIPAFNDGDNIGVLLGEPSGNLVRLDPDFATIPAVAHILFPEPSLTYGRASSPRSGRLVTCNIKSKDFKLPKSMKDHPGLPLRDGKPSLVVFQILGTGKQIMVPPSVHPETGEEVVWQSPPDAQLATLDAPELLRRVGIEAFLMVVRQFWPARGSRNEAAMALSRVLLEALATHYPDDEKRIATVDELVVAVAMAGGDGEESRNGKVRAEATLEKMRAGEETTGLTRLVELLELPQDVVKTFRKWLVIDRAVTTSSFPDRTKDGGLRASLPNTKAALKQLGIECCHDLFKLRYVINGHEIGIFVGEASDPALLRLREVIYERFGFDPATGTVLTAVQTLANHARFHPVRDYLDGLRWDRTPRIDNWLTTYGGAEETPYTNAVGALLLVAAVRRVREPGCKFDEMLVLESDQGNNKSLALQTLAVEREWFSDSLPLGLPARETIEALSGRWIVGVPELHGMRKSDIDKVKAFQSRDTDRARTAYAHTVTDARRQCVIVGTTNKERYLRDLTGNRRFWPVRVGRFDLERLKRDRDQLWAEAAESEASGVSVRLPEELWAAAAEEQEQRLTDNPFVSVLERVLCEEDDEDRPMQGKIATEDLWTALGMTRPELRRQEHFELLGAAMKRLGWTKTHLRSGSGKRKYFYVRGEEPHRPIEVVLDHSKSPTPRASYKTEKPKY